VNQQPRSLKRDSVRSRLADSVRSTGDDADCVGHF
jgi:hypothetical protein